MNTNVMEIYELIDGTAIIDNNFVIITANEALYRFMGISTSYTIMDIIHQVDLDDFIEVVNGLRPNTEKEMVIRMKRFDNSYRWMIARVKKFVSNNNDNSANEYIDLHMSDILTLEKQINQYRETLLKSSHIMALEGNIYFTYDCKSSIISFSSYVDNNIMQMSEGPLLAWIDELIIHNSNESKTIHKLHLLYDDFINFKSEFIYHISSNYFSPNNEPENLVIKASTISEKMKPVKIVGSIRNIDNPDIGFSRNTYLHSRHCEVLSFEEVNNYVRENIFLNSKCEIGLILVEIDDINHIKECRGEYFANELLSSIMKSTKEMVGQRGVVGSYKFGVLYIAIKNITSDLNTRAFVESLRNQISWDHRLIYEDLTITCSIGISRRPYNGTNHEILLKKAIRALEIANEKGHNRFIIYRDNLHGDIK